MKKGICIIVALIMVLGSISAMTEEFTVHGGVQFGMDVGQVMEVEKENGYDFEEVTYSGNFLNLGHFNLNVKMLE